MGIMKETPAVFAVLGVGGVAVHLATPPFLEFTIRRDCPLSDPSEACLTRMRATGHVWSRRSDLEHAKYWYGCAAEHGNPVAMFHLAWIHEELALRDGAEFAGQEAGSDFELALAWYQRSADRGAGLPSPSDFHPPPPQFSRSAGNTKAQIAPAPSAIRGRARPRRGS